MTLQWGHVGHENDGFSLHRYDPAIGYDPEAATGDDIRPGLEPGQMAVQSGEAVLYGTADDLVRLGWALIIGASGDSRLADPDQAETEARAKRDDLLKKQRKAAKDRAKLLRKQYQVVDVRNMPHPVAWLRPGATLLNGTDLPEGQHGVRIGGRVDIVGGAAAIGRVADEIAAHFDSPRTAAVAQLASTFDAIYPGEGMGFAAFTCSEADRLALTLATFGHFDTAVNVITGHCGDDDSGDMHGYIQTLEAESGQAARDEAAEVYVRRLMGDHDAQPADADAKRDALNDLRLEIQEREDQVRQLRQELGEPVALL